MSALRTNRDLYLFVVGLKTRFGVGAPTLERYLCGLWSLGRARKKAPSLTIPELAALLEGAFSAPAADPPLGKIPVGDGFAGWEHRILQQIHDLRDMAAGGRQLVPGEVMAVDARGQTVSVDPREIDDPVVPIDAVDWATFTHFLENGQWYE